MNTGCSFRVPQPKIVENQEIHGRERECMLLLFIQLSHLCINVPKWAVMNWRTATAERILISLLQRHLRREKYKYFGLTFTQRISCASRKCWDFQTKLSGNQVSHWAEITWTWAQQMSLLSKKVSNSSYPAPQGLSAGLETWLCDPALLCSCCHHLHLLPGRFGSNGWREGIWEALSVSWAGPKAVGQEFLFPCEQTSVGTATGDCCSLLTTTYLKNLFGKICLSSSGARGRV